MEWISVEDYPPSIKGDYIVYVSPDRESAFLYIATYYVDSGDWSFIPGAWDSWITHWMELPEAPKDKEVNNGMD